MQRGDEREAIIRAVPPSGASRRPLKRRLVRGFEQDAELHFDNAVVRDARASQDVSPAVHFGAVVVVQPWIVIQDESHVPIAMTFSPNAQLNAGGAGFRRTRTGRDHFESPRGVSAHVTVCFIGASCRRISARAIFESVAGANQRAGRRLFSAADHLAPEAQLGGEIVRNDAQPTDGRVRAQHRLNITARSQSRVLRLGHDSLGADLSRLQGLLQGPNAGGWIGRLRNGPP